MRFLFVDRILKLVAGEYVFGIKQITPDDGYLVPDTSGRLCFVSSLIGETLGQLAAWNVMHANDFTLRPVAGVAASAKVFRPVYVGETLVLESYIDRLDDSAVQYHGVARVGGKPVFTLDGALGPLLPMAGFIEAALVRGQFEEINRPGTWPPEAVMTGAVSECTASVKPQYPRVSLVFDKITSFEAGASIAAVKAVSRSAPYFPDHFPNKPVLPMTILLECVQNLAHEFVARSGYAQNFRVYELRKIKMNEFIQPGDIVACQLRVKREERDEMSLVVRCEVAGKRVCVLEVALTAAGNKMYEGLEEGARHLISQKSGE